MSSLNRARYEAHKEGIKIIVDKKNMDIRGYTINESMEPGRVDITTYYYNEGLGGWQENDFDSSETCFADARESARLHLR